MTIIFEDVSFSYGGNSEDKVLAIPSWRVESGDQTFIHGPSGCGKSTLLNLLSGILIPSSGQIELLGESFSQMSARQRDRFRANNIGYVFQQYNLIPYLSPIDNILLATYLAKSSLVRQDAIDILNRLKVPATAHDKQVRHLSIGQQQRVAIARALVNKPKLILADEPTSSLDEQNRDNFIELLVDMAQETLSTVLFVSHDMSLSKHFANTISMDELNNLEASNVN